MNMENLVIPQTRKLPKTTSVMSKEFKSQLQKPPTGQIWDNFNINNNNNNNRTIKAMDANIVNVFESMNLLITFFKKLIGHLWKMLRSQLIILITSKARGKKQAFILLFLCKMYFRAAIPNLFGTRDRFRGRQFFHGPGLRGWVVVSGGNASNGGRWGAADEASITRPPLTSCCS